MLITSLDAATTFEELCAEVREMCSLHQGQPLTLKWVDSEGSLGRGQQGARLLCVGGRPSPLWVTAASRWGGRLSEEEACRLREGAGWASAGGLSGTGPALPPSPDCPFPDWGLVLGAVWKGELSPFSQGKWAGDFHAIPWLCPCLCLRQTHTPGGAPSRGDSGCGCQRGAQGHVAAGSVRGCAPLSGAGPPGAFPFGL